MNLSEAFKALSEGKRVRSCKWQDKKNFFQIIDNEIYLYYNENRKVPAKDYMISFLGGGEWEIWKDPNETTYGKLEFGERFKFKISNSIYRKVRISTETETDGCMEEGTYICFPHPYDENVQVVKCPS